MISIKATSYLSKVSGHIQCDPGRSKQKLPRKYTVLCAAFTALFDTLGRMLTLNRTLTPRVILYMVYVLVLICFLYMFFISSYHSVPVLGSKSSLMSDEAFSLSCRVRYSARVRGVKYKPVCLLSLNRFYISGSDGEKTRVGTR